MHAPDDKASSSRSVPRRLIRPWEYGDLDAAVAARFAGGGFQLGIGLILFSLGRQAGTGAERRKCYRWAAWFLVPAALNFTGGLQDLAATRGAAWVPWPSTSMASARYRHAVACGIPDPQPSPADVEPVPEPGQHEDGPLEGD
jgi:hypothetical protein